MDRHPSFFRLLCNADAQITDAVDHGLQLAADCHYHNDRAPGMKLRKSHPHLPRPFRVPWGRAGLVYVVVAPIAIGGVVLLGSDRFALR